LGAGLGSADFVATRFGVAALAADNQYLKYAVELGVLGLGLHVLILAGLGAIAFHAWRRAATPAQRTTGLLVAVAAVGIAFNALTSVVMNSTLLAYTFYWLAGAVTSVAVGGGRLERA
jgi:O-antigen ligase